MTNGKELTTMHLYNRDLAACYLSWYGHNGIRTGMPFVHGRSRKLAAMCVLFCRSKRTKVEATASMTTCLVMIQMLGYGPDKYHIVQYCTSLTVRTCSARKDATKQNNLISSIDFVRSLVVLFLLVSWIYQILVWKSVAFFVEALFLPCACLNRNSVSHNRTKTNP